MSEEIKREPVVEEVTIPAPVVREPLVTELPIESGPPQAVATDYVTVNEPVPAGVLTVTTSDIVVPAVTSVTAELPADPWAGAPVTTKILLAVEHFIETGEDLPTTEEIIDYVLTRDMTPERRADAEAVKEARRSILRRMGDLTKSKRIVGAKEGDVVRWCTCAAKQKVKEAKETRVVLEHSVVTVEEPPRPGESWTAVVQPIKQPGVKRTPKKAKPKAKAKRKSILRPVFPFTPKQCKAVLEDIMPAFLAWPTKRRNYKDADLLCKLLDFIEKVGNSAK